MAGALDLNRADRQARRERQDARRAAEAKQGTGAPENKMLPGPESNKGVTIKPSARPELAGVRFASAPARAAAEAAHLTAADFPEPVKQAGVTTRDVREAEERRARR